MESVNIDHIELNSPIFLYLINNVKVHFFVFPLRATALALNSIFTFFPQRIRIFPYQCDLFVLEVTGIILF